MKAIFLGRPVHWLVVLVLAGLGWMSGIVRLHVTDFNLFLVLLIAVSTVALVLVIATSPQGEQVARDPIEDDETP